MASNWEIDAAPRCSSDVLWSPSGPPSRLAALWRATSRAFPSSFHVASPAAHGPRVSGAGEWTACQSDMSHISRLCAELLVERDALAKRRRGLARLLAPPPHHVTTAGCVPEACSIEAGWFAVQRGVPAMQRRRNAHTFLLARRQAARSAARGGNLPRHTLALDLVVSRAHLRGGGLGEE